jgi:hypothetical protein
MKRLMSPKHVLWILIILTLSCKLQPEAEVSETLSVASLPKVNRITYSGLLDTLNLLEKKENAIVKFGEKEVSFGAARELVSTAFKGFMIGEYEWHDHQKELLDGFDLDPFSTDITTFKSAFLDKFSGIDLKELLNLSLPHILYDFRSPIRTLLEPVDTSLPPEIQSLLHELETVGIPVNSKHLELVYQISLSNDIKNLYFSHPEDLIEFLSNFNPELRNFVYLQYIRFKYEDIKIDPFLRALPIKKSLWPFLRLLLQDESFPAVDIVLDELGLTKNSKNEYGQTIICDATVFYLGRLQPLQNEAENNYGPAWATQNNNLQSYESILEIYRYLAGPDLILDNCSNFETIYSLLDAYLEAKHITQEQHAELIAILLGNQVEQTNSSGNFEHEVFGYCSADEVKNFVQKNVTTQQSRSMGYADWEGKFPDINKQKLKTKGEDLCWIRLRLIKREDSYGSFMPFHNQFDESYTFEMEVRYLPPKNNDGVIKSFKKVGGLSSLMKWIQSI